MEEQEENLKGTAYINTYYLVLKLEEEVRNVKEQLVRGESPYLSLNFCEHLVWNAKRELHTAKEREENIGENN
jgi:hypothetical protein